MSKKLFLGSGLAPLPILVAAILFASSASSQVPPPPPAPPTVPVTVTIDSVANLSAGDPFGGAPDFFARIKIDGGTPFTTPVVPDSGSLTSPAGWTFTRSVRRIGPRLQVRIELDETVELFNREAVDVDPSACPGDPLGFGCTVVTVNRPDADVLGLDLNVDRENGNVTPFDSTGDASATATCTNANAILTDKLPCSATTCVTGSEGESATICFTITVGSATPGTLIVSKTGDTNDGNCSVSDCSLREAVGAARQGDTILLRALGHPYELTLREWVDGVSPVPDFEEPGHLRITRPNLMITGPETGASVLIRQTKPARIFDIHSGGSVTLRNLTLGGGVATHTSSAAFGHDHGGAIHNHGVANLINVTVTDSHAPDASSSFGGGGAIWNAGMMTLTHVTLAHNDAGIGPGGVGSSAWADGATTGPTVTFKNALIASNVGPAGNCSGSHNVDDGGNLEYPGPASCGFARSPLAASPIGATLATDWTFPLLPASAAIDGGTNTGCVGADQAGTPRPLDGNGDGVQNCDPGAVEYDPNGLGVIHQPLNSGTGQPGPVTLTFDNVSAAGTSTLTISSAGPARPTGYRAGTPNLYYDIGTAATFTGGVKVCIDYTGTTFGNEAGLRLFHHTGASWQDTTVSLDTNAKVICGQTTSFSVFAIFGPNRIPVAAIAEPAGGYRLNEGSSVVLQGSGSDADGDALTYEWSPATELDDRTLATPRFSPRDEGTRTYTLVVRDGELSSAPVSTTVRVDNVAPLLTLTTPAEGTLYRVGSAVSIRGAFTDPGVDDVHTCAVDWDDGAAPTAGAVTEASGAGSCAATRTFTAAGVYTLLMNVADGDAGSASASTMVVVYDPRAGFVVGAGQISSPPGAFGPNPSAAGPVTFNFTARYIGLGSTPIGAVGALLPGGHFASTSLQWLVVTGFKSQLRGVGQINGLGSYGFVLTAYDGQQPGGGGIDRLRLKIWNRISGALVYDNVLDPTATDDIDRAKPQAIGFASTITIVRL